MSVAEMQACLARLYVDDMFRRLFYLEPDATLVGYKLTEQEQAAIREIDKGMLDIFAETLKRKYKKRFQLAYPLVFTLLGDEIHRYFERYYHLYLAKPNEPVIQHLISFGEFVEQSLFHDEDYPAYTSEIVLFERLYSTTRVDPVSQIPIQAVNDPADQLLLQGDTRSYPFLQKGVQIATFRFDIVKIVAKLQQSQEPSNGEEGRYHLVFHALKNTLVPKIFAVNAMVYALLSLCNGQHDVSAIVVEMEKLLDKDHQEDSILRVIRQLLSLGVIGI